MNLFAGWRIAQNAPNSALKLTLLVLACVLTTTRAQGMTSFPDNDCFGCFACLWLPVSKNAPAGLILNYSHRETRVKCTKLSYATIYWWCANVSRRCHVGE